MLLKNLNNYFFKWFAYKSLLAEFQCYNKSYYVVFLVFFCIQLFPTFFKNQVFQGPSFLGSRFFWVRFHGPSPGSRSRFQKQPMQSNFIEITLLHECSHIYLRHVFRTISHKITLKRSAWKLIVETSNSRNKDILLKRREYDAFL